MRSPYSTVHSFYRRARISGLWDKILEHLVKKKDLCLKPDALVQYVRTQPGFHNWTRNRIIQELKDIGALVLQEENASTVHIDKHSWSGLVSSILRPLASLGPVCPFFGI